MHTDTTASRVEQYITAHRARVSIAVGVALMVILTVVWHIASALVSISSTHLDIAVFALSLAGSAIAALAFYWSAE